MANWDEIGKVGLGVKLTELIYVLLLKLFILHTVINCHLLTAFYDHVEYNYR
jgi:hypothetical protein